MRAPAFTGRLLATWRAVPAASAVIGSFLLVGRYHIARPGDSRTGPFPTDAPRVPRVRAFVSATQRVRQRESASSSARVRELVSASPQVRQRESASFVSA